MKKFIAVCFVMLAGFVLSAGGTTEVAVFEDITGKKPAEDDGRTLRLVQEYFKSELATHSTIEIVQAPALSLSDAEILAKFGIKRGKTPAKDQISKLCKEYKADYCTLVKIERKKSGKQDAALTVTVSVYKADGTLKSAVSRSFAEVQQADIAGIMLARDTAVAIHGVKPVDELNLNRMRKSLDNLANQKVKEAVKKNIDAVK